MSIWRPPTLQWLIIRPGCLTDEAGTGEVTAALAADYGLVSRDNVAAFVSAALHEPRLQRMIVELVDGPNPMRGTLALFGAAKASTEVSFEIGESVSGLDVRDGRSGRLDAAGVPPAPDSAVA